jgi:hypothetical protein
MQAFEQGLLSIDALKDEDIFEIQHHHLLQCLERATVCYIKGPVHFFGELVPCERVQNLEHFLLLRHYLKI